MRRFSRRLGTHTVVKTVANPMEGGEQGKYPHLSYACPYRYSNGLRPVEYE